VSDEAKQAFARLQNNKASDADQALLAEENWVPGSGMDQSNLARMERALKVRGVTDKIADMSNWDSLVSMGQTEERTNSVTQRVAQDGAITAVKSAIRVPEMAVGLADIVSGGHAGKYLEEAGF